MKGMTMAAVLLFVSALVAVTPPVQAQDKLANAAQDVIGEVQPVHMRAQVIGIDKAARTVTLRGEEGHVAVVPVSDQVQGFDKLHIGDRVDVLYKNALLVTAKKVTGHDQGIRERIDETVLVPVTGGIETARQIEVLATVMKIDRKQRLVTLRGAYQTQTLEVRPDVDLNDIKAGDTVHAVFVSAAALQITPQGASVQ